MRRSLILALVVLIGASCEPEKGWQVTLRGKVGFPQSGEIKFEKLGNNADAESQPQIIELNKDYSFEQKVRIEEPGYYRLNFYGMQFVDFILNKSDIEINVDGNAPNGFVEIKGSPDMDLVSKVQALMNEAQSNPQMADINVKFNEARMANDFATMEALQEEYMELYEQGTDKVATLLREQGPSVAVINLLSSANLVDRDKHFDLYLHVADMLKKEWPDYAVAKEFIAIVEKMKVLAVGQPAPEIALPNPEGTVVPLSSLRGKYVLVDFWAKWCGPCRKENPNVVQMYHKYNDQGFEVFGVSLDRNKQDWLQAIQEDGLVWTHVSDLKYFESQAAADYNITAIPFSILLDPNGVIIAKNLRGSGLQKKLAEIFDKG